MKRSFLLLTIILICFPVQAQNSKHAERAKQIDLVVDSLSKNYTISEEGLVFSKVIQAPNLGKNALYVRLLEILSSMYKNTKNLIQVQDKEQGFILGKGIDEEVKPDILGAKAINTIHHTIKIEVRERRFKVSITLTNVDMAYYDSKNRKSWEYHHPILNFYPFNQEIKLKYRDDSFNTIKFGITNSISLIDNIEDKISKIEVEDW